MPLEVERSGQAVCSAGRQSNGMEPRRAHARQARGCTQLMQLAATPEDNPETVGSRCRRLPTVSPLGGPRRGGEHSGGHRRPRGSADDALVAVQRLRRRPIDGLYRRSVPGGGA